MAEQLANNAASTLTAAIPDAVATSLTVANGTVFPASGNFRIIVDNELMIVGARSGNTLSSLTRGAEGTTAVAHTNGAAVTHVLTKGAIDAYLRPIYGTTPPTNPNDGDEWIYPADATNGIMWRFRYRAASASTYKWEFVGGPPLQNSVGADIACGVGSAWSDDAASRVTVPRSGDYLVQAAISGRTTASAQIILAGLRDATTGAYQTFGWLSAASGPTDVRGGITGQLLMTGQNSGGYMNTGGQVASGSAFIGFRSLVLTPRRVS